MADDKCEKIFKQWLGEYQGLIFKVVRAYAAEADDQDDLFQEVLLQMWFSIPNFQGKAKVSTWIYRVALNTALVWNRSEKRRRKHSHQMTEFRLQQANYSGQSEEVIRQLYGAIRKLSKVDTSLVLMYLDGLAYSEMAEILGISENNVGVKLNRAKKQLAQLLGGLIDDF
jgi:RNA polymerase sigma-70 factor (ECF subfamily)